MFIKEKRVNIKEYQNKVNRTRANLDSNLMDNIHMVLGMQTESAEIADVFKKKLAYAKDIDLINVQEELGDIMWYIANMCNINEWNLEDILLQNINKLNIRFPEGFSQDLALNRNLLAERVELEKKIK